MISKISEREILEFLRLTTNPFCRHVPASSCAISQGAMSFKSHHLKIQRWIDLPHMEMNMKTFLACASLLLLLAFASVSMFAQDTGAITGTVRDTSGASVAGAQVKITGAAGGIARTTTTNGDGD